MHPQKDKIALYQQFVRLEEQRQKLGIRGHLEAVLDYSEYCIRSELDKGSKQSIKYKKRKEQLQEQYLLAYNEQSNLEKLEGYIRVVRFVRDVRSNQYQHERHYGDLETSEAYTRSYNLKIWKRKSLKLDRQNNHMFCSKEDKVKIYNLDNYLLRESKNKDYYCFVMEALNEKPHIKSRTVHIGFKDIKLYNQWFASVKEGIAECQKTRILKELGIEPYQFLGIANRSLMIENDDKLRRGNSNATSEISKSDLSILNALQERPVRKYSDPKEEQKQQVEEKKELVRLASIDSVESDKEEPKPLVGTITQQLLDSDNQQQPLQEIEEAQQSQPTAKEQQRKRNLNIFHQIMPEFQLSSLADETGFQMIDNSQGIRLFRSTTQPQRYKFFMTVRDADVEKVFDPIAHIDTYLKWNPAVQEVNIKNLIRSENTAIVYQKHKAYSKIYRPRDFIFLRHVFKKDNNLYIVDKSLENANYPPFLTIVRGEMTVVWGVHNAKDHVFVAADIDIKNQGYLNEGQDHNLSMLYLKGLYNIPGYLMQKGFRKDEGVYRMFDLDWDIANNEQNVLVEETRQKRKSVMVEKQKQQQFVTKTSVAPVSSPSKFAKKKVAETTDSVKEGSKPVLVSPPVSPPIHPEKTTQVIIPDLSTPSNIEKLREQTRKEEAKSLAARVLEEDAGQVQFMTTGPLETHMEIQYDFDQQGMVRIPQDYLKHRYLLLPQAPSPMILQEPVSGHPIWKGEWITDKGGCGIVFVNQKKIDEQKGVLKFILTKIGKNLLSGKSILNISLPVDIFAPESNLERLAFGMTYAPMLLERAATVADPVERMKSVVAFGLTNSVLYLNMEKPFNPILGETFQGWINKCPVYMEQVSHHPPIASFMLLGRGYKMAGSLQSKVELHMNSGCGTTDGVYRIDFDDGSDICFITPGGQVSGLTYGDRKFNLVGRSYYWSAKHCLFLELVFDPDKKGFFSVSKKESTTDSFEGTLMQVTPEFLETFIKSKKKKEKPEPKDIIETKSKFSGVWHKDLYCNGEKILDLDRDFGCKMEYDKCPLPSDGHWREDIAYRRKQDVTRAQNQKERLEVLQRKDRKLREAKGGKKH